MQLCAEDEIRVEASGICETGTTENCEENIYLMPGDIQDIVDDLYQNIN